MLAEAFDFPRASDDWLPTILIGGILAFPLLSVLIVPVLVVQGYLLRVMRDAAAGADAAPSFTRWGELLVDGLKLLVVNVVYSLVVVLPILVGGVGLFSITSVTTSDVPPPEAAPNVLGGAVALLFAVVILALSLALAYLVPAALANLAIEDRLGAAFSFRTIARGAFTTEYATAWILSIVVGLVGGLIGAALSVIVVGVFVLFYVQVMTYYLWGVGFARGLARRRTATARTDVPSDGF